MFSWAVIPMHRLRWCVFVLNILMVAGTPVDGGHYFIDLVGGAIVAGAAILCAGLLQRTRGSEMRYGSHDAQVAVETGSNLDCE